MIRGYFGHDDIPVENVDYPLDYFTTNKDQMNQLLKVNTPVRVVSPTRPDGEEGYISVVDTEDNRTAFPYGVTFPKAFAWCRESEVTELPAKPDNGVNALVGLVMICAFFYATCTSCNVTTANAQAKHKTAKHKKADTLNYLPGGKIPAHKAKKGARS